MTDGIADERADVVVIGSGPAGLSAAVELRRLGAGRVVVLERETEPGGVPRHCGHLGYGLREFGRLLSGPAYARRLVRAALDAGAEIRTGHTATRLGPRGRLDVAHPGGRTALSSRAVLLALGARETPRGARLIPGGRPWGVMTTGALQQCVYLAGLRPFRRPLVVGSELVAFSTLLTLRHAGVRPVALIEEGDRIVARRPGDWIARLGFGVPVLTGTRLARIVGATAVDGAVVEQGGQTRRIDCDGIVLTGRFRPEAALLADSGIALDDATGGPDVDQHWRCAEPGYFAAGNLLRGIETAGCCWREGRAAARAIAATLAGDLPAGTPVTVDHPGLRYVYPQRLAVPGGPIPREMLKARVDAPAEGRLRIVANDREVWGRRVRLLPERRISLPGERIALDGLRSLRIELVP